MTILMLSRSLLIGICAVGLLGGCKQREPQPEPGAPPGQPGTMGDPAGPGVEARRSPTLRRGAGEPVTGVALATKYIKCIDLVNDSNWDRFESECLASTFATHQVDVRELDNPDALIRWMKDMKAGMPDWKLAPQLVLVSGRNTLAMMKVTGTHRGTLRTKAGDVAATNKPIGVLFFHRIAWNDEAKAAEGWVYSNEATMLGQLGQLPAAKHASLAATRPVMQRDLKKAPIIVVTADDAQERANLATLARINELSNAGKHDKLAAFYTDDAVVSDQMKAADLRGKQQILDSKREMRAAFSDMRVEATDTFAAGDYAVVLGRSSGTHDGDLGGLEKTGKRVELSFAKVVKFENGKIAHVWKFQNGLAVARQLGILPPADTAQPNAPTKPY